MRARLSAAERAALAIAVIASAAFGALGIATSSPSVWGYVGAVVVVAAGIWSLRREPLPDWLAIALGVAVVVHLAGGLVNVGNDVLYNAAIGPYSPSLQTHLLQYDHFAHAYASLVGTLTIWMLLDGFFSQVERRHALVVVALAGIGVGGLNEMVEFVSTLAHRGAHVGGYANTGWDLVSNAVGVAAALAALTSARVASRWRAFAARQTVVEIRRWLLVATAIATTVTAILLAAARSGYDSSSDTVSLLGAPGAPHAALFRALVMGFGCSVIAAAGVVREHARRYQRAVRTFVVAYGVGTAVSGLVPKNPAQGPHSAENLTHVGVAVGGGVALALAMLVVACWGRSPHTRRASAAALTITMLGALVFRLTWGSSTYGAVQRILLATAVAWLVGLAIFAGRSEAEWVAVAP